MRYLAQWEIVTVAALRDLTPTIREITLDTPWLEAHAPGAHLDVEVWIDGKPETRSYSLIGCDAGPLRRIAVKAEPESKGGSRYMRSLDVGARVKVTPPSNSFELDRDDSPVLLIAAGIGVTPLVGMAEALVARGADVRMIYAGRTEAEMAYLPHLQAVLGDRLALAVSETHGRLDLAGTMAALPVDAQVYICGPLPMLDAAKGAWAAAGRPRPRLRFETFGSGGRFANQPFVVRVPRLNLEVAVPANRTMLDALTAAGVTILSDCRRGECGLCALDILASDGDLDHRDVFFSDHQHAAGTKICVCVSRAAGGTISVEPPFRGDVSPTPSKVFG